MSCPAVQCISASPFLLQVFTSLAQKKKKKKPNKQLELHIKILIIIPIFFFFFFFLVWTEHIQCHQSCFFKVREYKVIRTLETKEKEPKKQPKTKKNMYTEHVFKLYQFWLGGKVYIIPAHQSAQAFLANHKNLPQSQSHWPKLHQKSGFLCQDLEYNS